MSAIVATVGVIAELFTLSGSPYRGDAKMTGRPLRPEELFSVLNLERPGLETVSTAVARGDRAAASAALLAYYRARREPGWMTGQSFDPLPVRRVVGRAEDLSKLPVSDDDRRMADDALRHIFHILQPGSSYMPHDYGPDINWDADPVNDIEWPCGMHRLQYWDGAVTRCYSATGDERYARLWVELISDWMRKNPLTVENASYPGLTHRRTVFFVQRRWFVFVDEALGDATGDLDLHFQLAPGPAVIEPKTKTARSDFPDGGNVLVWADPKAQVTLEAEEAWHSPKWFDKVPLPAFRYRHQARQAPARFVTIVAPYEGRQAPVVEATLDAAPVGAKTLRLQVGVDGVENRLERNLSGNRLDSYPSSRSDEQRGKLL